MTGKVLITGGLGYIGGRVAKHLVQTGYELTCGTRRRNLTSPEWLPSMSLVYLDWTSSKSLESACQDKEFVIHLAAANEIEAAYDPIHALQINGIASLRLLEASKRAKVKRFLKFSTAHVYGAHSGVICETTLPRSTHPYAITHRVMDDFLLAAHDQDAIEGVVLRLSNGFGVPATHEIDRWSLLVNDLCRQAAETGHLRLQSSGKQLRNFITLRDVARSVEHFLKLDAQALCDGIFNVGGTDTIPVLDMAQRIADRWQALTGRSIDLIRPSISDAGQLPWEYSSAKLAASGFTWTSTTDQEIEDTLKLCLDAFAK